MQNQRLLLSLLPFSLLLGALGVVSAACSGSSSSSGSGAAGGGSAAGGDCFDYSSFDAGASVSFSNDVVPIWRVSCGLSMSCHGNPTPTVAGQHYYGPAMGTTLTPADLMTIHDDTVGTASIDEPDMDVVKAGDPAHSFMMYKLDGDPTDINSGVSCTKLQCAIASPNGCLLSMPQGGPELSLTERNTIRSWIAQGALDN